MGAVVSYYSTLARLLATEARRLLRAITVDHLDVGLVVASGDAAETAQNYGRVCAVLFPAEAFVESEMRVRKRQVRGGPDFLAPKGKADLDIRLHAVPVRITWSFFRLLFSFIFIDFFQDYWYNFRKEAFIFYIICDKIGVSMIIFCTICICFFYLQFNIL